MSCELSQPLKLLSILVEITNKSHAIQGRQKDLGCPQQIKNLRLLYNWYLSVRSTLACKVCHLGVWGHTPLKIRPSEIESESDLGAINILVAALLGDLELEFIVSFLPNKSSALISPFAMFWWWRFCTPSVVSINAGNLSSIGMPLPRRSTANQLML